MFPRLLSRRLKRQIGRGCLRFASGGRRAITASLWFFFALGCQSSARQEKATDPSFYYAAENGVLPPESDPEEFRQNPEIEEEAHALDEINGDSASNRNEHSLQQSDNNLFAENREPAIISELQQVATVEPPSTSMQPEVDSKAMAAASLSLPAYEGSESGSDFRPAANGLASQTATAQENIIWWLGLDYQKDATEVKVEIVTLGHPAYEIRYERGVGDQLAMVIRFKNTKIRKKLLRAIDASEFYSPIAHIVTRYNKSQQVSDVVLSLRDAVKPKLFAHDGNVLLSFPIPERYFGNIDVGMSPSAKAARLSEEEVAPVILAGSVRPSNLPLPNKEKPSLPIPDHAGNEASDKQEFEGFETVPAEPLREKKDEAIIKKQDSALIDRWQKNEYEFSFLTLAGVAQDDFDNNFVNQNEEENSDLNLQSQEVESNANGPQGEENFDRGENLNIDTSNLDESFNNFSGLNQANDEENASENRKIVKPSSSPEGAIKSTKAMPETIDLSGEEASGSKEEVINRKSQLQPISIEFKGATLREVINAFSQENGINFIYPEDVGEEKVYLSFNQVSWDQALQAVLETHSLGVIKLEGDVVRIDRLKKLDEEKKELEKVRESASHLIPTQVLVVRLSYARAEDVVSVVKNMLESYSHDKRTKVEADKRTNSVIVEAIPTALSKIKALITRVDLQTPQVKVDTRIIEVLKRDNLQLGINWAMPMRTDQSRGLGMGNIVFPSYVNSAFSIDTGIQPNTLTNRSAVDLHFGSINNLFELDVRLRMAESQNQIRSLQNNSVVVLDNEQAETRVGQIVYLTVPAGEGENQLSSVEYVLKLTVTPHITADGAVQMDVEVENSSAIPSQKEIPDKNTRLIKTKLLRENGETAVIGGVYTTEYTEDYAGVPFFSRIPLLGVFFRNKVYAESKRELIIMVTPTVINSDRSLQPEDQPPVVSPPSVAKELVTAAQGNEDDGKQGNQINAEDYGQNGEESWQNAETVSAKATRVSKQANATAKTEHDQSQQPATNHEFWQQDEDEQGQEEPALNGMAPQGGG